MSISLNYLGDQMGKTTNVKLSELVVNGYTRTLAVDGYKRVNPFEVEAGDAPDPATETAPHNLSDWEGYTQWTSAQAAGTNFDLTAFTSTTADFSWTRPAGYTRDTANLQQVIWIKACNDPGPPDSCGSIDPTSGGTNYNVGDGTSTSGINCCTADNDFAAAIVLEWDEGDASDETSDKYAYKATLTKGSKGLSGVIYWHTPACNDLGSLGDGGTSSAACIEASGTNYYSGDAGTLGALNINDNVWSDSGCSTTAGTQYISDGTDWIEVSSGNVDATGVCLP